MSTWMKLLIALGCLVVATGAFVFFFGVQSLVMIEGRGLSRHSEVIHIVPAPLRDDSVFQGPTTVVSAGGFQFDSPWPKLAVNSASSAKAQTIWLNSPSGNSMSITSGRHDPLLVAITQSNLKDNQGVRQIYGDEAVRSDYDCRRTVLQSTPDDLSFRTARIEAFRKGMFLAMKPQILPQAASLGIFFVETPRFKGFQYGVPNSNASLVQLDLYSENGYVSLHFLQAGSRAHTISQSEINRVVQSLQQIPVADPDDDSQ